jgi:23S rRNA (pseudouridine1915-N3)-methyltransferase
LEGRARDQAVKAVFYSFETKTEPWVEAAKIQYQKKIQPFFPLEIVSIKSPSLDRDDSALKKKAEAEKFAKLLKPNDFLVVFDEGGKEFKTSEKFSDELNRVLDRSPSRLVFLIGGAFGIDKAIVDKAQANWSLSGLTFNHWLAQIVALEQIYRGMTILKRIPYHNR